MQVAFYSAYVIAFELTVLTGFFLLIGFNELHIAAYGSIIGMAGFFGIAGAWAAQKTGRYKRTSILLLSTTVVASLAGVIAGAFGAGITVMPVIVLIFLGLFQISAYMATPVTLPWFHNVVGAKGWSSFISTRFAVADISVIAMTLIVGALLYGAQETRPFLYVFCIAAALGLVGVSFLGKVPDTAVTEQRSSFKSYIGLFKIAITNKECRDLLILALMRFFAYGMFMPFQAMFLLEELNFDYATIQLMVGVSAVVSILFYKVWAHFQRRFGNANCLKWNVLLSSLDPLLWIMATRSSPVTVYISFVLFGFSGARGVVNAGFISSYLGSLYQSAKEHEKPVYHSLYFVAIGIGLMFAPMASGALILHFNKAPLMVADIFPSGINGFRIAFICTSALLLATGAYAFRKWRTHSDVQN